MREKTLLFGALTATAIAAGFGVYKARERPPSLQIAPVTKLDSARLVRPEGVIPIHLTASDGTGLRLSAMRASAAVEDPLALTELHLTFENPENRILEGRFQITLPQGASVSRFAMKIGDTWQEGEVVEKQKAREAYEDALHRRQDPALMEQAGGNEFTARVFPIPALGTKEIIIAYSETLEAGAAYVVPLKGLPALAKLDIDVHATGSSLSSSSSSSSAAKVFGLHQTSFTPAQDFVVDARSLPRSPGLRNGNLVMARVVPFATSRPDPVTSVVVLVDTSASRALGIAEQASLVQKVLAKLPPDAKVTVACFDQEVQPIYEGTASGFGAESALAITKRGALGASDLQQAIAWAGEEAKRKGARRVVIVSDGVATAGETDGALIKAEVEKLRAARVERIDAVAIGGIRDDAFFRSIVRGILDKDGVVLDSEIGADGVARRLSEATSSGIPVKVSGAAWSWPRTLDGLQAGDEVIIHAEIAPNTPVQIDVGGQQFAPDLRTIERPLIERAWAQAKIQSLTEAPTENPAATKREIVLLSTQHRVLSAHTAMLVLETDADYTRFGIDRRANADVLTVRDGRVVVAHESRVTDEERDSKKPIGKADEQKNHEDAKKKVAEKTTTATPPPPTTDKDRPYKTGEGERRDGDGWDNGDLRLGLAGKGKKSALDQDQGEATTTTPATPAATPTATVTGAIDEAKRRGASATTTDTPPASASGYFNPPVPKPPSEPPRVTTAEPSPIVPHQDAPPPPPAVVAQPTTVAPVPTPSPRPVVPNAPSDHGGLFKAPPPAPASPPAKSRPVFRPSPPPKKPNSAEGDALKVLEDAMRESSSNDEPTSPSNNKITPPTGIVRHGDSELVVERGLSSNEAQRVLRGAIPRLRACYSLGLRENASEEGALAIRITLASSGATATVDEQSSSGLSRATTNCSLAVIKGLRFPAPANGDGVFSTTFHFLTSAGASSYVASTDPRPETAPWDGRFKKVMDLLQKKERPAVEEAINEANRWRAEDPGDVMALVALGEAFEASGDIRTAARAYGSILELFSSRADSRRFAGERLERLHDPAALRLAIDTYKKAALQRPDHPASHRLYAFALLKHGDYEKAFEALRAGAARTYPEGRFRGVERILHDDLGLIASAWSRAQPKRTSEIHEKLRAAGGHDETEPSLRFVLVWETDANDVDFHIYDGKNGHAWFSNKELASGGELYADVTTGYGPECFTIRGPKTGRAYPYNLQAHYYARGPMGYGMGKLEVIDHDGKGNLVFDERPFVVMKDHAYVDLGSVDKNGIGTPAPAGGGGRDDNKAPDNSHVAVSVAGSRSR